MGLTAHERTLLGRCDPTGRLPNRLRSHEGELLPDDLVGSEIVRIGGVPRDLDVEGGGLLIDYRRPGENAVHRVVFAFNELGMWTLFCQSEITNPLDYDSHTP